MIVPLILRGRVITDDLIDASARGDQATFQTPDPRKHQLTLADPMAMRDVHALTNDEVLDYLVALGTALRDNAYLDRARELSYASAPTTPPIVDEMYRVLPMVFERDRLEDMLETGMNPAYLDVWVPTTLRDGRTLDVRAFGARAVHITAGNSPVLAALAIIRNALTRGDALIKSPSNDPLTAAAIGQTMCDLDAHHPITRHLAVAYWRGGDEELERDIYQPRYIEKIVAWGGFASMKHVTRYIQPGVELVSFDPKRSVSILGPDALNALDEVAARLAVDIGQINQSACSNARTVFVIGASEAQMDELAERVYAALLDLPERISTAPKHGIARNLRVEVDAARLQDDWFRVIGGENGEGAIIVSRLPEPVDFAQALNDRVANLVPVDSLEDALEFFDAYTQTIGVFPEALKRDVREYAGLRGGQRVVSLGFSCMPSFAGPQDAIEPLRRLCRWVVDEHSDPVLQPLGDIFLASAS